MGDAGELMLVMRLPGKEPGDPDQYVLYSPRERSDTQRKSKGDVSKFKGPRNLLADLNDAAGRGRCEKLHDAEDVDQFVSRVAGDKKRRSSPALD